MEKTKILLIEDDEILSKVLYEELTEAGFEVGRAFDGEEGLKMATSGKPDLVLLDIILPKKQGFDVLEELKQSPITNKIPVIMVTMLGKDEDIKRGLELGANDYIVKSQHAVGEIVDKIKTFFSKEAHPAIPMAKPSRILDNVGTEQLKKKMEPKKETEPEKEKPELLEKEEIETKQEKPKTPQD